MLIPLLITVIKIPYLKIRLDLKGKFLVEIVFPLEFVNRRIVVQESKCSTSMCRSTYHL